ncbi:glycoside hydrolase family 16 protein [Suillus bovinus]|uniref:glycoside hydrolase family 16 protein n=1 Tax=Suillus bovinus TaxID=48563 RepID=UPI001B86EDEA|nr:glycoside hydrolase family 16 protein [Suillus bovinus]KAG2157675.1 glycoside hydrolase family 16 protein [Suillus bovinus]
MDCFYKLFLAALLCIVLVDVGRYWYLHHHHTTALIDKTYVIQDFYQGNDFFKNVPPVYFQLFLSANCLPPSSDWIFAVGPDPTGGNVIYQSQSDAQSKGLAYVNDNNSLILAVDSTSTVAAGGQRASVRITSQNSYDGGLFIFDASYMPVGCSTWPSFWTVGPHWPMAGEIDIVEGVNNHDTNQMTLHTGSNQTCTNEMTNSTQQFTGQIKKNNCHSSRHADSGCSIEDTNTSSFGYGFNNADGGVFALLWDNSAGMSIWHFARANIPADLIAQTPRPSTWGIPAGLWSLQTCDISTNFYEHQMVIDTTICGDWAGGSIYAQSGCPGTCSDMVANATNYVDAKWVINYVAVYH